MSLATKNCLSLPKCRPGAELLSQKVQIHPVYIDPNPLRRWRQRLYGTSINLGGQLEAVGAGPQVRGVH